MKKQELFALLMRAATSPNGIAVSTNNADRLRQKLYPVKKLDTMFSDLAIIISPTNPETELFIAMKKEPKDGDA